jgi:cytochrome c peroxidase
MQDNRHKAAVPDAVLDDINSKLDSIFEALKAYEQSLSPKERHDFLKMGDKSVAFVEKANEFAHKNPDLVPTYQNLDEFDIDVVGARNITGTLNRVKRLSALLDDIRLVAGNEAFKGALAFYNGLLAASKAGVAGAKTLYAELKARFPGARSKKTPDNT